MFRVNGVLLAGRQVAYVNAQRRQRACVACAYAANGHVVPSVNVKNHNNEWYHNRNKNGLVGGRGGGQGVVVGVVLAESTRTGPNADNNPCR